MAAAVMEGNNSGEGRCKKHCETIQGLCDTCDELVCVKCMMGHHNGHTFTDLEARVGEKMELLQERVQEMRGRVPVLQQRVAELSIQDDKNQRDTEAVIASITQKGRLIDPVTQFYICKLTFVNIIQRYYLLKSKAMILFHYFLLSFTKQNRLFRKKSTQTTRFDMHFITLSSYII